MQNEGGTTETWNTLKEFGFLPDDEVISDVKPGLSINFGNLKLAASCCVNMRAREIVLFTGVLTTPRAIASVQFEMPRLIQSSEQCAAWIVWNLDKVTGRDGFTPTHAVKWLAEGRNHQNSLPWVIIPTSEEKTNFVCEVEPIWLRVALKALREILLTAGDEEVVVFGFDGEVLKIRCAGRLIAIPAEGTPAPKRYIIRAGKIRHLPIRLMEGKHRIEVWRTHLYIARYTYEGVSIADS